jgi:hypothetical protein
MVEIVQRMEHHSLAYAELDILVTFAKCQVSAILENVLDVSFEFYFITMGSGRF